MLDRKVIDEWIKTEDRESFVMSRRLIREEGLLCGGSSGSVLYAAIKHLKTLNLTEKDRVVVVLQDGVRNYMTKFLSREWCIENQFLPYEELRDLKQHRFNGIPFEKLGVLPVKT